MWPNAEQLENSTPHFPNFKIVERELIFKKAAGTSRGILRKRKLWFLNPEGVFSGSAGECAPLAGLSAELEKDFEKKLHALEMSMRKAQKSLSLQSLYENYPSIYFAIESCIIKTNKKWQHLLEENPFKSGQPIPINGLVWMDSIDKMKAQVGALLDKGFACLKFKIGALDWSKELELLKAVRKQFPDLEIRVDANGAFSLERVEQKLAALAQLNVHSIEQPIAKAQWKEMAKVCAQEIIPIALDEELIGVQKRQDRIALLEIIKPQYLILKPGLLGGFYSSQEWIALAEERNISWWITSALESNIGLSDIASFASHYAADKIHGLGTGSLFTNNIESPLFLNGSAIQYNCNGSWNYKLEAL